MREITKVQLVDISRGGCFLGSGGGGPLSAADRLLEGVGERFRVRVVTVDEAAESDRLTAVVAYGGTPSAAHKRIAEEPTAAMKAVETLDEICQRRLGKRIGHLLPIELGAVNSVVPCIVGAELGLPVVDADGAGRAVPYLEMLTLGGLSPDPMVIGDDHGHTVVLNVDRVPEADSLFKAIVRERSFGGVAGLALWPLHGHELERALPIRDTLLLAEKVGAALRSRGGPIAAVVSVLNAAGWSAFELVRGQPVALHSRVSGGLDVGRLTLAAIPTDTLARVYFANESFVLWRTDSRQATALGPDLICAATLQGTPISNAVTWDWLKQQEVALVGVAAREVLRTDPRIFGRFQEALADMGFGGRYVPIEGPGDAAAIAAP